MTLWQVLLSVQEPNSLPGFISLPGKRRKLCWNRRVDDKFLGDLMQRRGGEAGKCEGAMRASCNRDMPATQHSPLPSRSQHLLVPKCLPFYPCLSIDLDGRRLLGIKYGHSVQQNNKKCTSVICVALSDLL